MKLLAKHFSSTNETLSVATINMYQKFTGIIYIDRDGEKSGIGTGFCLKFPYVLTNNHVINDIDRKAGVDPVKICFNYTNGTIDSQKHSQKYSFKRKNSGFLIHFSSPIDELDYVILEVELEDRMDTDDGQSADKFPALAERINCFPKDKSALNIIGHPGGRVLQIDPRCSLMLKKLKHIPVYFKLESIDEKQARRALSEDHIPYDTSMFEGSSGSPVFNPQGHLVAVHTRGLFRKGALRSAFEQGVALTSIMNNVKLQAKDEVQKEIMSRIFPERLFEVVANDRQPAPASMASPE
ncbi:serine protease FAM111A-like [Ptychodera flava]|uniref:serine protease FAM111A-like n=1 Tax=Ptychodera flava TaxID=63121 RepID=UPI003969F528